MIGRFFDIPYFAFPTLSSLQRNTIPIFFTILFKFTGNRVMKFSINMMFIYSMRQMTEILFYEKFPIEPKFKNSSSPFLPFLFPQIDKLSTTTVI